MFNQYIKKIENDAFRRKRLRSKRRKSLLRQKTLQKKLVNREKKRTPSGRRDIYITWTTGSYDDECGFTITGFDDNIIYMNVPNASLLAGNDSGWAEVSPEPALKLAKTIEVPGYQMYVIRATDTYGDGWNGASLKVNLDNANGQSLLENLENFTISADVTVASQRDGVNQPFFVPAVATVSAAPETIPVRVSWHDFQPLSAATVPTIDQRVSFSIRSTEAFRPDGTIDYNLPVYMEVINGKLVGNLEDLEYWHGVRGHTILLPVDKVYRIRAETPNSRGWPGALKFQIETGRTGPSFSQIQTSEYLFFPEGFTIPFGAPIHAGRLSLREGSFEILSTISETIEAETAAAALAAAANRKPWQLPVYTATEIAALTDPGEGMMVYNSDNGYIYWYTDWPAWQGWIRVDSLGYSKNLNDPKRNQLVSW